jgi:HPt (histidine-containing phosphotransfer) domain-containing protein
MPAALIHEWMSVDADALARLLNNNAAKVTHFTHKFIETTRTAVRQMSDATAEGDLTTVGRLAHSLKSSSATVGASGFASLCLEIEGACKRGDTAQVGPLVSALPPTLDAVSARLLASGAAE